jgi:hypothetical protein
MLQFLHQYPGPEKLPHIVALKLIQHGYGLGRITHNPPGYLEKLPVGLVANLFAPGVDNEHGSLLRHPAMVGKPIARNRPKPSSLNQKPSDDPDAIPKKPRIGRVMDVTLYGGRIQTNLSPFLYPLGLGIAYDQPIDRLPGPGPQLLDILLKGRNTWLLPHPKPRKSSKGMRILQMKSQLLIAQIAVLLQYCTSKHLLGRHALTARVSPFGPNHIPVNKLIDGWIVIKHSGDGLQFPGNLVARHGVEKAQLRNPFFTHLHPHRIEIYPTISRAYCEDDTTISMKIQQKNERMFN